MFLPTKHLDVVECWVVLQRSQLLQAELLAASVEAIRAVDADAVVIATGPILHGTQAWGTLWAEQRLCLNHGGILMDEEQQETNRTNQANEKTEVVLKFLNKMKLFYQTTMSLFDNK